MFVELKIAWLRNLSKRVEMYGEQGHIKKLSSKAKRQE